MRSACFFDYWKRQIKYYNQPIIAIKQHKMLSLSTCFEKVIILQSKFMYHREKRGVYVCPLFSRLIVYVRVNTYINQTHVLNSNRYGINNILPSSVNDPLKVY